MLDERDPLPGLRWVEGCFWNEGVWAEVDGRMFTGMGRAYPTSAADGRRRFRAVAHVEEDTTFVEHMARLPANAERIHVGFRPRDLRRAILANAARAASEHARR